MYSTKSGSQLIFPVTTWVTTWDHGELTIRNQHHPIGNYWDRAGVLALLSAFGCDSLENNDDLTR